MSPFFNHPLTKGLFVVAALLVLAVKAETTSNGKDTSTQQQGQQPPRDLATSDWLGDTTTVYSQDGELALDSPLAGETVNEDIVLMLFLGASSGPLPLHIEGWVRVAECFKSTNSQERCYTADDCALRNPKDENFCDERGFPEGPGYDLGTVAYYKIVKKSDNKPDKYVFKMLWKNPAWAIMTALKTVRTSAKSIVRNVATTSNDGSRTSIFPKVGGGENDILLFSMSFDDAVARQLFKPPKKTTRIGYVRGDDETGTVFGRKLTNDRTLIYETKGDGSSKSKDALISITLKGRSLSRRNLLRGTA